MNMPRFLTQPRWLVGHVLVVVLAVLFVNLGLWQLRRLDERQARNARVLDRSATVIDLPPEGFEQAALDDLVYRHVRLRGRFDATQEVLVRFRSRRGLPGYEVVTPLVVDDGAAVLIDRGWVPLDLGDRWPDAKSAPPSGEVQVTGLLASPEPGNATVSVHAPKRRVTGAIRVSAQRREFAYPRLYGLHVLADELPDAHEYPIAVDPPDLTEGPHLSYAVQWFSFTTVGVIGWIALVATRGRRATGRDAEPA
jgi:surfeit locus 1 family protein